MAEKKKLVLTAPVDESFEAFVNWIKVMCEGLGVPYTTPEDKARENWQKFWASKKSTNDNP